MGDNIIPKDYGIPYLYKMMRTAMRTGETKTVIELTKMIEKEKQKDNKEV